MLEHALELPRQFASLEPFIERWAIATMPARMNARLDSTAEEGRAFYAAAAPLFIEIMRHLSAVSLEAPSPPDLALLRIAMSFTEIALTQEVFDPPSELEHAKALRWLTVMRAPDAL